MPSRRARGRSRSRRGPRRRGRAASRWRSSVVVSLVTRVDLGEAGEQLAFAALHAFGVAGFGVVVLEEVKDAVDDEERQLGVEGGAGGVGLALRDGRTDDDVTDDDGGFVAVGGGAGAASAFVGVSSRG